MDMPLPHDLLHAAPTCWAFLIHSLHMPFSYTLNCFILLYARQHLSLKHSLSGASLISKAKSFLKIATRRQYVLTMDQTVVKLFSTTVKDSVSGMQAQIHVNILLVIVRPVTLPTTISVEIISFAGLPTTAIACHRASARITQAIVTTIMTRFVGATARLTLTSVKLLLLG